MRRKTGYIRAAAASPILRVANTDFNVEQIINCIKTSRGSKAGIIVLPELAVTAYTCADLFFQQRLYDSNLEGLKTIIESTAGSDQIVVIGFYFRYENNLYNCAAVIQNGNLLGVVPKMFLPNNREFYEHRWFASGIRISNYVRSVRIFGHETPFGHLIFTDDTNGISLGAEICQDLWLPSTPGSRLCLNGASIILNPSASDETVGKADYRRQLVHQQSAANICAYVYSSSGVFESTTDLVYSGHHIISEYGTPIAENRRFERENTVTFGDIDYERLRFERSADHTLEECASAYSDRGLYQKIPIAPLPVLTEDDKLIRRFEKNPFVPSDKNTVDERCEEIFRIQTAGLAKRTEHVRAKTLVVGISGGLDSTLALLVCAETFKMLGRDPEDIIAVTMPGFGTTDRTHGNAMTIMNALGTTVREIPIGDAVLAHFGAIGHDPGIRDVTYENCQARERTQILMDIANETGGFVVGTGDLSESALGWATYNGDHMSMYAVNISVPKTLVKFVVGWVADHRTSGPDADPDYSSDNAGLTEALHDIMDTPVSPELLPPGSDGSIAQKTEERIGPYVLHDFFLFYTLRFGMRPRKLLYLASQVFADTFDTDFIKKWLTEFYRRFFQQQYKRSCIPDGPKVGTVTLSPRGDWRMPSDADPALWLKELTEWS